MSLPLDKKGRLFYCIDLFAGEKAIKNSLEGEFMKAIVYEGVRDVKVKTVKDPTIVNPDDIIIKVTATAICGSDLHLIHGMVPNMPKGFILGHETMGIVEEVGKEVYKVRKGDRDSSFPYCLWALLVL